MDTKPLSDKDDISHYLSPSRIPCGVPSVGAFKLKKGEVYLSGHWLQFFECSTPEDAIAKIRDDVILELKKKGKFVVFKIGDIREAVKDRYNPLRVEHFIPSPCQEKDRSHSGMFFNKTDDQVSSDLRQLVRSGKTSLYCGQIA